MTKPTTIRLNKKYRKTRGTKSYSLQRQISMLDPNGNIPFSGKKEVRADPNNRNIFHVDNMALHLTPVPKDPAEAVKIIMDALATFHREYPKWRDCWPKKVEQPICFECWNGCSNGSVTFNTVRGDKLIYATYLGDGNVELILPSPVPYSWKNAGLIWLRSFVRCCERNAWNPRPWRGKPCGCK